MSLRIAGTVQRADFHLVVDVTLEAGSVVAVLGPNGSGKSTLLRAIAGLQPLAAGAISLHGRVLDDAVSVFVQPRGRAVGVVFQDYALFPHLTVLDNVEFGPRSRGVPRADARRVGLATLDRLGISDLAGRRPAAISGGQAQRVALARALATSPDVLLLDEPMAALDIETRDAVRTDLELRLADFDGCAVLVTHDPLDAMLLADRVIVLEDGSVVQDGTPSDLARRPATPYVAALMGVTLLRGWAHDGHLTLDGGGTLHAADATISGRILAVVRPESVTLHRHRPEGSARNVWQGTVASLQPSHDRVRVLIDGAPGVVAAVTPGAVAELGLSKGTAVWLSLKAVDLDVYPSPAH